MAHCMDGILVSDLDGFYFFVLYRSILLFSYFLLKLVGSG